MSMSRKASLLVAAVAAVASLALAVPPAVAGHGGHEQRAGHADRAIVLPGATGTEGVASGAGSTFYAGDLLTGDVFRGDVRRGTAAKFVDAPPGRFAAGMKVDLDDQLLFVSGGPTGQGYVYSTVTGAALASYTFATAPTFINDVAVTDAGAWFTDSARAVLYFVPVSHGRPGTFTTLPLSGPAADLSGAFNNNGIQAVDDGSRLLVAHSGQGAVNVVDASTGASRAVSGVSLPNVDGILLEGRTLWAVQNADNQISQVKLAGDLSTGATRKVITSALFQTPTTVARFGGRLAAANAKFDTGFPPRATRFEVVVVHR